MHCIVGDISTGKSHSERTEQLLNSLHRHHSDQLPRHTRMATYPSRRLGAGGPLVSAIGYGAMGELIYSCVLCLEQFTLLGLPLAALKYPISMDPEGGINYYLESVRIILQRSQSSIPLRSKPQRIDVQAWRTAVAQEHSVAVQSPAVRGQLSGKYFTQIGPPSVLQNADMTTRRCTIGAKTMPKTSDSPYRSGSRSLAPPQSRSWSHPNTPSPSSIRTTSPSVTEHKDIVQGIVDGALTFGVNDVLPEYRIGFLDNLRQVVDGLMIDYTMRSLGIC